MRYAIIFTITLTIALVYAGTFMNNLMLAGNTHMTQYEQTLSSIK